MINFNKRGIFGNWVFNVFFTHISETVRGGTEALTGCPEASKEAAM